MATAEATGNVRCAGTGAPGGALLSAEAVSLGYSGVSVLRDLDFHVSAGEVVALLGPNGAGKTTLLLGLAGVLKPLAGRILMPGTSKRSPLHRRARNGLGFVPGERAVFTHMTTAENLRVGRAPAAKSLELFPELERLLDRKAGLLSGGEQQMLSLARALAREPSVLLADELSLGLAPMATDRLLAAVRQAADRGVGAVIVEQQVQKAIAVADRVYVMQRGAVVWHGSVTEAKEQSDLIEYLYFA